jgi:secernin
MASDMVVALGRSTVDGNALFGHNCNLPRGETPALVRAAGRDHAAGETVRVAGLVIPQARRTHSVLATRAGRDWGYRHGVNDRGVAVGCTPIWTRLLGDNPSLSGPDLVRLVLERAGSALQAVEVLTDLVGRYGQGAFVGEGEGKPDAALLIADGREAYVLEAAGRHWVLAQVGSVRAVCDACFLRRDWDRISRGLSDLAIQRGWCPEDGCKLDFAGALRRPGIDLAPALHRWGKATMLLEQHSGAIDGAFLRLLLRELSEEVCPLAGPTSALETASSLIVRLPAGPDSLPLAWCAFGLPGASVYLPVLPVADLPTAYADSEGHGSPVCRIVRHWRDEGRQGGVRSSLLLASLASLQQQIDDLTHELVGEADLLHRRGDREGLERLAGSFMQHCYERFEEAAGSLGTPAAETADVDSEAELVLPKTEL